MYKSTVVLSFLLFAVCMAVQGQPLVVWPGDANNNGIASHADLLAIGLSWDSVGPSRAVTTGTWAPQAGALPWGLGAAGVDKAYSDCNGDGVVDALDVAVLTNNIGRVWAGGSPLDSNTLGGAGFPPLALQMVDSVYITNSDTIDLDVVLGSAGSTVGNLYGLAFSISFDQTAIDAFHLAFNGGWINFDGQAVVLQHVDTALGRVDVAITRRDGMAVSGNGYIGSLGIVMDDDIRISGDFTLPFEVTFATAIGPDAQSIFLHPINDTLHVATPPVPEKPTSHCPVPGPKVFPSPAYDWLQFTCELEADAVIRLLDLRGAEVYRASSASLPGQKVPIAGLGAGVYFLEIHSKNALSRTKVCIGPLE